MSLVTFYEHDCLVVLKKGILNFFLATSLKFWKSESLAGDSRTFRSDQGTVFHTK